MNYIANSKNRKLKNKISLFLSHINFQAIHFPLWKKLILSGFILGIISLFLNWIYISREVSGNGFSMYSGFIGYIMIIPFGIILSSLFSKQKIQTFKSLLRIRTTEWHLSLLTGWVLFTGAIIVMNMSLAMSSFVHKDATIGSGLIFWIISGLVLIAGWALRHKEEKNEIIENMYIHHQTKTQTLAEIEEVMNHRKDQDDKKNMTLPF